MNTYNDIHIGFINNENIKTLKKQEHYDILIIKLRKFFQDHCLVQYNLDTTCVLCSFCQEVLPNNTLLYYQGTDRYIFPEYLYHYIRHHKIQIDERLIEFANSIPDFNHAFLKGYDHFWYSNGRKICQIMQDPYKQL